MKCEEYRSLRSRYANFPLPREVHETDDYSEWVAHFHDCDACGDWELARRVEDRGHDPTTFPCVHIAYHSTESCADHPDPWDCPHVILVRLEDGGYGIPIRDGGTGYIEIQFCPWCGRSVAAKAS